GLKHRAMQPAAVKLRVGMGPYGTLFLASRSVVPTRHHPPEKGEVAGGMIKEIFCKLPVIINRPVKIVEDWKFFTMALRHLAIMGRKFSDSVQAERLRILKIECLEAYQIN